MRWPTLPSGDGCLFGGQWDDGAVVARAMAGRIVGAIGATGLSMVVLAGEEPSSQSHAGLYLAKAVTMKSDHVMVNPDELKAAGVDPGAFTPPKRAKGGSPSYPESAARDNAQGTVSLECLITEAGAVRDCRVTRSVHPAADRSAMRAIQRWTYEPARVMGQPRSIVAEFRVIFRLE
jgi:TonB family protein